MADLKPCMFCGQTPMVYPRTCNKDTPYNPADRAFPVVRCRCGISLDGEDWKGPESVVARWNALAPALPAEGQPFKLDPPPIYDKHYAATQGEVE